MNTQPLTREEIISVIEGKGAAPREPNLVHIWVHPENPPAETEWKKS